MREVNLEIFQQNLEKINERFREDASLQSEIIALSRLNELKDQLPSDIRDQIPDFGNTPIPEAISIIKGHLTNYKVIPSVSNSVFMISSFSGNDDIESAFGEIKNTLKTKFNYDLDRLDQRRETGDFVDKIKRGIRDAAFVIADLTEERPNCYYEYGFAEGLGKPIIQIAHKGTHIHSDLRNVTTIHYENTKKDREILCEILIKFVEKLLNENDYPNPYP